MKKIYVLEKFDFSEEQLERLRSLGDVKLFDRANEAEQAEAAECADAILVDWIAPDPMLEKMKKGQLMCLAYTGYSWVKNIQSAKARGVVISNTPNYSTNAVAEHHLSLMMACAKHVVYFNNIHKSGGEVPFLRGKELTGAKVGIIGLGRIGSRLAQLLSPYGVELMTYNDVPQNAPNVKDVDLHTLLKESDFVCNTCRLTPQTRDMIGLNELKLMKPSAVLTSTTGGIINLDELAEFLHTNRLFGVGLDDVNQQKYPSSLLKNDLVICTYHRAFDTEQSQNNRINLCIDSIEAFFDGHPINTI